MAKDSARFAANLLRASADGFAGLAASRLFEDPSSTPAEGFEAWREHLSRQLRQLAAALESGTPEHFAAHLAWVQGAFQGRGLPVEPIVHGLDSLRSTLQESLPGEAWAVLPPYFDAADQALRTPGLEDAVSSEQPELLATFLDRIRAAERRAAIDLLVEAHEARGLSVPTLVEEVLAPALRETGRRWHQGESDVAEEHLVTATTLEALTRLATIAAPETGNGHTVLLSGVAGDTHEFGVRAVATYFEIDGWRTICLGVDTPARDLAHAAARYDAHLVALGATLDIHRTAVAEAIAALREERPDQRVLVGGAAFMTEPPTWKAVGADAYAAGLQDAVRAGRELVGL